MDREILIKIKQDYTNMVKISGGDFSEIAKLENNPIVQRYKHLLRIKESYYGADDYYRQANFFSEIIHKYSNGLIKQTNNIWFWFFDVSVRTYEEIFSTTLDMMDKDRIVAVYRDLENSTRVITIPIENQGEFESNNNVIRGKRTIIDSEDRYYNTKYEFFNLCINGDQDLAVNRMLQEELSRAKEIEEEKEQELTQLDALLNYKVISEEEYGQRKQAVLSKK